MLKLAGATPGESRWTNIRLAIREASNALNAHCARFKGPGEDYCQGDGATRLAGEHENAWAACFNGNNWVENSSRRRAYEACMSATDPFTKLCDRDRKASMTSCPYFTVSSGDVHELQFYHDRWSTDPDHLPATAVVVSGQPATSPARAGDRADDAEGGLRIHAHRARALGQCARWRVQRGLNPSTTRISAIAPEVTEGLKGRVELIPAGTEVSVFVRLVPLNGSTANGGHLDLQIITEKIGKARDGRLDSQNVYRRIAWPAAGAVLLPANSTLSFATQCGCPYSMSVAEFRKRAATRAASRRRAPRRASRGRSWRAAACRPF